MNARAETIADKPIFRDAYRKRRGVVPIDAFHQKDAKGKLHMIKRADGEPLAIAAIWENWKNPHTGQWSGPSPPSRCRRMQQSPRCMIVCRSSSRNRTSIAGWGPRRIRAIFCSRARTGRRA
jgi:putative SOS response-associated peptidase YedK